MTSNFIKDAVELVKQSHPYATKYKGVKEDEALQTLISLAQDYLAMMKRGSVEGIQAIIISKATRSNIFDKVGNKIGDMQLLSDFEGAAQAIKKELLND